MNLRAQSLFDFRSFRNFGSRNRPLRLAVCAGLSAAIYFFCFTLPYPLLTSYATPLLDLGKLTHHSAEGALIFTLSLTALFIGYAAGYRVVRASVDDARIRRIVIGAPLLFAFILLWAFPFGAIDVYDYAFHGKLLAHYHVSPITHAPIEFSGDAWLRYVAWPQATLPYGPVWVGLSGIIYATAGDDLLLNLLGYKLLAISSLLADAALVYAILRRRRPPDALAGFFFVAWNPLLLIELAVNAHNDALMVTFILLSLYLYQRKRITVALFALTLAALIKFPAIVILPIMLAARLKSQPDWRARLRLLTGASGVLLATISLAYWPFWDESTLLTKILPRQDLWTTSLSAIGIIALRPHFGDALAQTSVRAVMLITFVGATLRSLHKLDDTFQSLARTAFLALALLLGIATSWFQPWYLAWLVPLAPLAASNHRTLAALWSWSVLWNYFIFDFAWYWNPAFFNQADGLVLNASAVLLVFGPPFAYLIAQSLSARRRSSPASQRFFALRTDRGAQNDIS